MAQENSNNRKYYLDIIRIMACFFVIVDHTAGYGRIGETSSFFLIAFNFMVTISETAVGLFVMISGCLFLGRKTPESYSDILKRAIRFIIIIVAFSLAYYWIYYPHGTWIDFFKIVLHNGVTRSYWYMYMYIGILFMLPIIRKMCESMNAKDYCYFFAFSFLFCSIDFLTNMNTFFSVPIFSTFIGMFILGYFLDNYVDVKKNEKKLLLILAIGGVGIISFLTGFLHLFSSRFVVWDNIFYIVLDSIIFLLIKILCVCGGFDRFLNRNKKIAMCISRVSGCTLGIYLLSDLLIIQWENVFDCIDIIPSGINLLLVRILVFTTGAILTMGMKRIPLIKRLL